MILDSLPAKCHTSDSRRSLGEIFRKPVVACRSPLGNARDTGRHHFASDCSRESSPLRKFQADVFQRVFAGSDGGIRRQRLDERSDFSPIAGRRALSTSLERLAVNNSLEERWGFLENRLANWMAASSDRCHADLRQGNGAAFAGQHARSSSASPLRGNDGRVASPSSWSFQSPSRGSPTLPSPASDAKTGFGELARIAAAVAEEERERVGLTAHSPSRGRASPCNGQYSPPNLEDDINIASPTASELDAWRSHVDRNVVNGFKGAVVLERLESLENSVQTITAFLSRAVSGNNQAEYRPRVTAALTANGHSNCNVRARMEELDWLPDRSAARWALEDAAQDDEPPPSALNLLEKRALSHRRRHCKVGAPPMLGRTGIEWEESAFDCESPRTVTDSRKGRFRWPLDVMKESEDLRMSAAAAAVARRRGPGRYSAMLSAADI